MAARIDHPARGLVLAIVAVTSVACKPAFDPDAAIEFSDEEWEKLQTHALRDDPPDDPTNRFYLRDDVAALGQKLFYLDTYSGSRVEGSEMEPISCAACHDPAEWFQVVTDEIDDEGPHRNSPTLVNTAYYTWYTWDGRTDSLWSQSLFPPEKPMQSDRTTVVLRMLEEYGDEYREVFDDDELTAEDPVLGTPASPRPNPMTEGEDDANIRWMSLASDEQEKINTAYVNFGKALAAYQRKLVSRNSPFDRYLDGDDDAISESAKNGLRLFEFVLPCGECHTGPTFTDNEFHNIGTGENRKHHRGRYEAIELWRDGEFNQTKAHADGQRDDFDEPGATTADQGKFRTKHLRQVAATPQYMHDGRMRDLELVIDHYRDVGLAGVYGELDEALVDSTLPGITVQDRADLKAFLETLTGDPISDELIGAPP
jgi:cytochrome c peroxidase